VSNGIGGVFDSSTAFKVTVLRSGVWLNDGGVTTSATVHGGGLLAEDAGVVSATLVERGGRVMIDSGTALGVRVEAGGSIQVRGGLASGIVVWGSAAVARAVTAGAMIRSGGVEHVAWHAIASATVVSNGGRLNVDVEGIAAATTVSAGGLLLVSARGTVSQGLVIEGGSAVISGAMAAGQSVSFTGEHGVLELGNLPAFHASIQGLAKSTQRIDLDGFQYGQSETVTWTQSGTSGTLRVDRGGQTASLSLIGSYVTGDFKAWADGHHGTFLAASASAPAAQLAQAIAGFTRVADTAAAFVVHPGEVSLGRGGLVATASSGR
jgi:autotransporter passenger strand-loop-strand repeat protein